ncbi:hypothetical protein KCP77_23190 [Salmonella enterica subsp. enterica]|nr:hypothetical protein KCP77_23190 [Salmonella enterica subsp. enterica]
MIKNDHHLTTADIPGGKQFRQPGFTSPMRVVPSTSCRAGGRSLSGRGDVVILSVLPRAPRIAADGRQRAKRVQPAIGAEQAGKAGQSVFAAFFDVSCRGNTIPEQPACGFRLQAVGQSLRGWAASEVSLSRKQLLALTDFSCWSCISAAGAAGCGDSARFSSPASRVAWPAASGRRPSGVPATASASAGACVRQINAPQLAVTVL